MRNTELKSCNEVFKTQIWNGSFFPERVLTQFRQQNNVDRQVILIFFRAKVQTKPSASTTAKSIPTNKVSIPKKHTATKTKTNTNTPTR